MFCVQHSGIEKLMPADQIDPVYGATRKAASEGVEILTYAARFELELSQVELNRALPVILRIELAG